MTDQPVVQVSRLLDERGLSSFQIKLIVWSFFIVLIDGYDIAAIAFAAPHLVRSWGVAPSALGPVFSASLVGILFGSAIFGWVGDRFGRKAALVSSNLLFGVFTLAAAYSTSLDQMFWLRLLAGLGIGGVIPNVVAINAEVPRHASCAPRLRSLPWAACRLVAPSQEIVTAVFVPQYGWPILFMIGGIAPIVIAVAAMFGLPESIKYMAIQESQRRKMEKLIAAIRPDFKVPANARFVVEDEKQFPGFNPAYLFRDGLALITPLLWLLFALNLMGYFFLLSWTPTLLTAAQLPPTTVALAGAMLQVGGTVGALVLCWWLPKAPLSRHCDHVRDRRAGSRLDRLCRIDLQDRIADRDILCRLLRTGHSIWHQRCRGANLPDVAARQRIGMAIRAGTDRIDRRPAGGCVVRRPSGPENLYMWSALPSSSARSSATQFIASIRRVWRSAQSCARRNRSSPSEKFRSGSTRTVLRWREPLCVRTGRTRARPITFSPKRRIERIRSLSGRS